MHHDKNNEKIFKSFTNKKIVYYYFTNNHTLTTAKFYWKILLFFQFIFYCSFNFQSLTRKRTQLKMRARLQHETTTSVYSTISNWAFNFIVKYRLPCNYNSRVWIKVYIIKWLHRGAIKGILN